VVSSAELSLERIFNLSAQALAAGNAKLLTQSVTAQANTGTWGEYTVDWSGAPGLAYLGDPATVVGGELEITWDVSNIVDDWVSGARVNYGLALVGDGVTSETVSLHARES